jgi:phosphoglycolate phosphatase-like HAD superfamily hydrolase
MRHTIRACLLAVAALVAMAPAVALAQVPSGDPLPSWNDGPAKQAIVAFVERITRDGAPDFVPPAERVAVFDNDGTLWAEQPVYFQIAFALDEVRRLAPQHPDWQEREPFRSVLAGDLKGIMATGEKGLLDIMAVSHSGMTTADFAKTVADWLATARHPTRNRPYTDLVYQPQIELLAYLRASGVKTFIVSGGGIEFMRVFAEKVYGIPPEQVIGSSGVTKFELGADGKPVLVKEPKVEFVDDGPGKPVGINRFVGRRPILAFGNSDGDLQMLQWTAAGDGASMMMLLHHDDAEREWAYDRQSHIGRLDKALAEAGQRGWTVASMKRDWKVVFPP